MATITQRVNKKGDISFRIKVSCGYTFDNKQIIKCMTYKPDKGMTKTQAKKEAQKQAVLFEEQCQNGNASKRKIKFSELANEYLSFLEFTKTQKTSSIERLKSCKERTYKALGNLDIDKVTYRQVQNFILSLAQKGQNKRTGQGLSTKSQKHYLTFISDVMNYGIKNEIITHNPCKGITLVKTEPQEKDIYSLEELKSILAKINEKATLDYRLFFSLLSCMGLRRGEAMGLEYKDFDFNNGTVFIQRTSNYRNSSTGIYTSTPKTKSSCRVLAVPEFIIDLVKELQEEQKEQSMKCGDLWVDSDRLFITWNGTPMHPNTPYTWLERFCSEQNLPFKGLHSFRHFFATQAIINGTDIATVSSVLGHSQTSTTLNIYTHAVKQANVKAINVVADLINS